MDRIRSSCAAHISGQAWLGSIIGLRRLSLRFPGRGEEAGFLFHYNKTLRRVWRMILLAYVLVFGYWTLNVAYDVSAGDDAVQLTSLIVVVMRLVGIIFALVQVLLLSLPRLLKPVSFAAQEGGVVAMIVYTQLCVMDRPYLARSLGYSDPEAIFPDLRSARDSDSFILLSFCMILMVSHVCLPVRWCALVAAEAMTVLMYGTMCYILDSPEPQKNTCFVYLLILVLLIAVGKRQSEVNDRLIFTSLLSERSQRAMAEFRLSQAKESPSRVEAGAASEAGGNDEAASYAPTTSTGEVFTGLDDGGQRPALETIMEIGKKEQWVIDNEEVVADPDACLGSGGFGMVMRGTFHGTPVALKFHRWIGNARPLSDIGNELRLLRKLRHPNIVLLHGACLDLERSDLVVVMELVYGVSMSAFVARGPADGHRCKALLDICLALMYLHSRSPPIVHGDLKPANVMVENRGRFFHAKLLDFGLARLITRSARPGGGTYRWMAPGVLSPGGGRLDVRDDVFAVGLLIFFAVTGQKPFEGMSDRILKKRAHGHGGEHPALVWPRESSELMARSRPIVEDCLRPSCLDRPSVDEVHKLLRAADKPEGDAQAVAGEDALDAVPSSLWRAVFEMRRRMQNGTPAHQPEVGDEPDFAGSLSPVREDEVEGGAQPREALRFIQLRPTPVTSMRGDLLDAAVLWNFPAAADVCCDFHAAVRCVQSLCTGMMTCPCQSMQMSIARVSQCPECRRLYYHDVGAANEMECDVCGYVGPPLSLANTTP